nr:dnaJ homolog subfamily B member 8 [Anas platyrhynchos]
MVDYYKVLGLQKNASQDDIRKSYCRLALQWHPDKNPSNKEEAEKKKNFQHSKKKKNLKLSSKKVKAVAEAYEVLSDPQKRSLYDRSVKESISHRARSPSMGHNSFFDTTYVFQDPNEIFRDFFGGMDPFVHAFWDPFGNLRNDDENKQGPSGRGSCSSLFSDFVQSFMPFNPFSPSEQPTFSFAEDMAEPHSFRSVLTTTEGINGKKVTTRKIIENGQETIEVEEDGHLRSVTINGREHLKLYLIIKGNQVS